MSQSMPKIQGSSNRPTTLAVLGGLFLAMSGPALADIGEAVDAPSLTWNTGGDVSWLSQTSTTHDGVDAAESGDITHSQSTWIETTVVGPGTLFFWWKVSCEAPDPGELYDFLSFTTNGMEAIPSIASEVDWSWHHLDIAAGSQTLRWSYHKDSSVDGGLDRGWVDGVGFFTGDIPPIITTNLQSTMTVAVAGTTQIAISAIGTAPLNYQWRRDGVDLVSGGHIAGANSSALTLAPLQSTDVGTYVVVISNVAGSITSSPIVLKTLDEAVDTTNLVWTMSGDVDWMAQTNVTHDGSDAAATGLITDSESTSIQTTINGPGVLSFWWKVSSEIGAPLGDRLQLISNSVSLLTISGEIDWRQETVVLGNGSHVMEWRYSKDSSLKAGQDRGWLDQVVWTQGGPAPTPFSLTPDGLNGSSFQLTLTGEPNRVYRLYSSSNLLDWVPIQTNSDPSGIVPFIDPSAGEQSQRYYRGEAASD